LAWQPNLFIKIADEIDRFKMELELALAPHGKKLPCTYNGAGSLPKFSESKTIVPIIENLDLKNVITSICREIKRVKITSLDKKIEERKIRIQNAHDYFNKKERTSLKLIDILEHKSTINQNFQHLLKFIDEKRKYFQTIQILEQDNQKILRLKSYIESPDNPLDDHLSQAIKNTIESNERYQENMIKEKAILEKASIKNKQDHLSEPTTNPSNLEPKSKSLQLPDEDLPGSYIEFPITIKDEEDVDHQGSSSATIPNQALEDQSESEDKLSIDKDKQAIEKHTAEGDSAAIGSNALLNNSFSDQNPISIVPVSPIKTQPETDRPNSQSRWQPAWNWLMGWLKALRYYLTMPLI
jgi:hypothetical protein